MRIIMCKISLKDDPHSEFYTQLSATDEALMLIAINAWFDELNDVPADAEPDHDIERLTELACAVAYFATHAPLHNIALSVQEL